VALADALILLSRDLKRQAPRWRRIVAAQTNPKP
jgi:hypothetical protein